METLTHPASPLRQRMLEDMRMRKLAPKTRDAYIRAVSRFAQYLGRSPGTATAEDLRRYQLHLVDAGTSPITLNATITGLKFLFDVTLGHSDVLAKMQSVRVPRKLPVVLNKQEVARLIACAGNIKHQTALSVAYGTGLRVNEVISLKVSDIDSQRMTLRVEQGKGSKDRYAMLSPLSSTLPARKWLISLETGVQSQTTKRVWRGFPGWAVPAPKLQTATSGRASSRSSRSASCHPQSVLSADEYA
jgi:site-specific recombinase XerD